MLKQKIDFVANGISSLNKSWHSQLKIWKSNQCTCTRGDRVSVGQTLAIMRGDAININAQAAEAGYMMQNQIIIV
jgi:hypothetical protein